LRELIEMRSGQELKPLLPSFPLASQLRYLLFISGFSALVLEIVYVKLLRYWVGNTAYAVACVLCAYMAGLAVGSLAAGKWLLSRKNLLGLYGGLELLVGLYSVGLPGLMGHLKPAYVDLTSRLGPDTNLSLFGHFLAAGAMLLLPTLLMGASFPIVVRAGSSSSADRPEVAEKLYAANLTGAALGALSSDFLLIGIWGLGKTLVFVAVLNAAVAAWAMALGRRRRMGVEPPEVLEKQGQSSGQSRGMILLVALAGGFLVLFQEIVWTHMAGRFLDSTVYGFAVMLFAVIAGLGLGAVLVARNVARRPAERLLPWTCLATGSLAMLLMPFWDNARVLAVRHPLWSVCVAMAVLGAAALALAPPPRTFALIGVAFAALLIAALIFRRLDPTGSIFWITHAIDFAVCVMFLAGPAVLMGTIFPLVLEWYLLPVSSPSPAVAPVYASNTIGSLAGIIAATFLVLPRLGVERSGRAVNLVFFALGLLLLTRRAPTGPGRARRGWMIGLGIIPALAWTLLIPGWDFNKTHEVMGQVGQLIYAREDLNGGLTTVIRTPSHTQLYTNEMIQAGTGYLVADQARVALIPLLHVRELDRAMVIGLGSGQSAGIVALFPFKHIDLVDFSPGVVEAGRRFFEEINLGVYRDHRVKVHIADGRHYLFTHPEKLSLLTIEVSRLWVAGEGDLYTREFYELSSERLAEGGVLQQWVPLFRLTFRDVLIILRTVRAVFPHVAMYLGAESGMIVASRSPLQVDYARLRTMDHNPQLNRVLARIKMSSLFGLLGDCVLVPEGVDSLLATASERRISTDLWPHLEHSAARHYLEGLTTDAARRFFLTAQEFRSLPVVGVDTASQPAIEKSVLEERNRQAGGLPPF
jgi:spermidine synthase